MRNISGKNEHVGIRIRELRLARDLSIRALADLCGLSANAISMIERGENSPTVSSLHRLASALDSSIVDFFRQASEKSAVFVARKNRLSHNRGSVRMESLGVGLANQQLEPFLITVEPGTTNEQRVVHPGQEFVFCVQGSAVYEVGDNDYALNQGDSLLLDATAPHRFANVGEVPTQLLVVFQAADDVSIGRTRHLNGHE